MSGSRDELSDVRQTLLGFTEGITKTLENTKSNLDDKLKQLAYLQQQLGKLSMLGVSDQIGVDLKEKLASALDKTITEANHANKQLKEEKLNTLSKVVNDVESNIKKPGSR